MSIILFYETIEILIITIIFYLNNIFYIFLITKNKHVVFITRKLTSFNYFYKTSIIIKNGLKVFFPFNYGLDINLTLQLIFIIFTFILLKTNKFSFSLIAVNCC